MQEEIELKLAVPREELARLRRLPLLRSLGRGRAARKRLTSTYFDTPEFALKRAGMALRIRELGRRRVQTLKARLADGIDGLQHFAEHEAELFQDRPDFQLLEDEALRGWMEQQGLPEQIAPVFSTRIERTELPLRLVDSDIELAIDEGEIEADGRRLALSEIELELKSGRPQRLYELALMILQEGVDARLESRTKAARGYGLYEAEDRSPQKAAKVKLPKGASVEKGFALLVENCLEHLRANEPAVFDGIDPEGVHQMRVAVRRLRALLSLFKPLLEESLLALLREELRWLQRQLGPARDWDVFLGGTLEVLRQRLPAEEELASLQAAADALRAEAYDAARRVVASPRYASLLLRLRLHLCDGGWFASPPPDSPDLRSQPLLDFAADVLDKRARKLAKGGRRPKRLSELQLHQLRIEIKKLRYALEFFRSLYPARPVARYLGSLARLQDSLGALNDAVVGHALLDDLEVGIREQGHLPDLALARATGVLEGWHAARVHDGLAAFPDAWKDYRRRKAPWK